MYAYIPIIKIRGFTLIFGKCYDKETYSKRHHGFGETGQPQAWQYIEVYQNIKYKMRFDNRQKTFYNLKISNEILEILKEISKQFVRTKEEVIQYFYEKNLESRRKGFEETNREIEQRGWRKKLDNTNVKAYFPEMI